MTKHAAKGVVFAIESSTPDTYVTVGQVYALSGPTLQRDALDVSCHDSYDAAAGTGGFRSFVSGFADAGEVTLSLRFDPSEATQSEATDGLLDYYQSGAVKKMRITWPNAADFSEWDFEGIITGYSPDAPFDGVLEAEVSIKVTGQPTFTAAP